MFFGEIDENHIKAIKIKTNRFFMWIGPTLTPSPWDWLFVPKI